MHKSILLTIAILIITNNAVLAHESKLQSYYSTSNFLETTPSIEGGAIGGMFNPAALGLSGNFSAIYWNDIEKSPGMDHSFTIAEGFGGLGFSWQHWDYQNALGITPVNGKIDDFQLGLGFGDESARFGIGYGWSKGDINTAHPRCDRLTIGGISRPNAYLSYGAAVTRGLNQNEDYQGIMDFGVRPFRTPILTVFSDMSAQNNDKFKDVLWSVGAIVEPVGGIAVKFKVYEGGAYTAGLSITSFGTQVSASQQLDKHGNNSYMNYGVRVGAPQKGNFSDKAVMNLIPQKLKQIQFEKLEITDKIRYQRYQYFDKCGHTLMELLEKLEEVKNNPLSGGLVIKITEEMSGSWEMLWEVREKMKEVQFAGKTLVVFFERGGMGEYYLASVADKIMVDPEIALTMVGFNLGRTYYKNFLEKIGVGFDEWRFFTYKSALEGLSRENMSDADREQRTRLIERFYEVYRADICASRKITPESFDHIINNVWLLTADSMLTHQLVDTIGRWDDMEDYLENLTGSKKIIAESGGFKMQKPISRTWGKPPEIAVIYAIGACSMNSGINARKLQEVIKEVRDDDDIKAVVFRADSPGGDVLPSDIVALELKKTAEKKPVIVSQGQYAASGGYWISMYGDKIVASPWTLTGSIGVIGGWFYDAGLNSKFGVNYDKTQVGKHADLGGGAVLPIPFINIGVPARNMALEERAHIERWFRASYDDFVTKVATGRKMEKENVEKVGQGRIWTGADGKDIGLVDELGGLEMAIAMAREKANIGKDDEVVIRELPKMKGFDPSLFRPRLFGIKLADIEDDPELVYIQKLVASKGRPFVMIPPSLMP
ncbi:signal peptide peptidase SppA [bacterium]|nr:signal peptide peptidase SppA [bacterium]